MNIHTLSLTSHVHITDSTEATEDAWMWTGCWTSDALYAELATTTSLSRSHISHPVCATHLCPSVWIDSHKYRYRMRDGDQGRDTTFSIPLRSRKGGCNRPGSDARCKSLSPLLTHLRIECRRLSVRALIIARKDLVACSWLLE